MYKVENIATKELFFALRNISKEKEQRNCL